MILNDTLLIKALLGAIFGLLAFALAWMFYTNADVQLLKKATLDHHKLESKLTKHWKLHSWAKDEINKLRATHGFPIESWPDISD